MIDDSLAESRRSRAIADDFRRQGFTVMENPSSEQLPEFLAGYRPDLVAQRADNSLESGVESVVVVVKSRSRLRTESHVGELAELLRERPDWRLELSLVEVDGPLEIPEVAIAFGLREIWGCHDETGKLLDAGFDEAAVLTAWAAAEATVRFLVDEERQFEKDEISFEPSSVPRLLSSAVYYGVISKSEYVALVEAKRQRDAFSHGFYMPGIDAAQIAREILSTTTGLLEQVRSSPYN